MAPIGRRSDLTFIGVVIDEQFVIGCLVEAAMHQIPQTGWQKTERLIASGGIFVLVKTATMLAHANYQQRNPTPEIVIY